MPSQTLTVFAPAKINLALHVTGQRPDGYHLMDMLVAFADFGDAIAVSPADGDEFIVEGPFARTIPLDGGNLVLRARDALRSAFGAALCPPVSVRLTKNIPPASGMGGGSSDAAATLKGLTALWALANADLAGIGVSLGADVPMCLAARPLRGRGIGEILETLPAFAAFDAVLVNPGVEVATPAVFKALAKKDNPPLPDNHPLQTPQDVAAFVKASRNDLQTPALTLAPEIGGALAALAATGSLAHRMTGSGATCFGIFSSQPDAERAAAAIRAEHPGWFVAATKLR